MKERIPFLADVQAREMTGFTQSRQNELDVLMDKLQRDRTLADREWEVAQKLADEERAYQRQRSLAAQKVADENASLAQLNKYLQAGQQPSGSGITAEALNRSLNAQQYGGWQGAPFKLPEQPKQGGGW